VNGNVKYLSLVNSGMPKVSVYLDKAVDMLTRTDVDDGVAELKRFAAESGYSVSNIEVVGLTLDGSPSSEFTGNAH
jgi:hypothetical protein